MLSFAGATLAVAQYKNMITGTTANNVKNAFLFIAHPPFI
jgi:hypothetical protein